MKKLIAALLIMILMSFLILDNYSYEIDQYIENIKYSDEYEKGIQSAKNDYKNQQNYKLIYFGFPMLTSKQYEQVHILDSIHNINLDFSGCIILGGEGHFAKGYNQEMRSYIKKDFNKSFTKEFSFILD